MLPLHRNALLLSALLLLPTPSFAGFVSTWTASSGLRPDQIFPAWTLNDTASPENPVLSGGALTLATSPDVELMSYIQSGSLVDTSGDFYIEATVKRISGSSSSSNRAPIAIGFTTVGSLGNILFIGNDEMFFLTAADAKGATASVQTDDAFHTYRIEVSSSGAIKVFYDSVEKLTSATVNNSSINGSTPRVLWGEGTILASGTSEWQSVSHNALAQPVPEPPSFLLLGVGAALLITGYRCRRAIGRTAPIL